MPEDVGEKMSWGSMKTKRLRGLRMLGALSFLAFVAGLASSCSVLVDSDKDQCVSQSDCDKFPGTLCQGGICSGCSASADCVAGIGEYTICRKDTHLCASLLSDECQEVVGSHYDDDAAIILGGIMPLDGDSSDTGIALLDAIRLALIDLDQVNDLPPAPSGASQRPLVVVACTDSGDSNTGQAAAHHLVDDIGVPAILGPAFSGVTLDVAQNVTIPAGVLLFSPSATSTEITGIQDKGLVWRTSPSDTFQSAALKQYVPVLEQKVRADNGLVMTDKVKLAVLHKGDSYGSGLNNALLDAPQLQLNQSDVQSTPNVNSFLQKDYGDPSDIMTDPPVYQQTVDATLMLLPHIILVLGTDEGVSEIFQPIEEGWPAGAPYRPLWVFSDGGETTSLRAYVAGDDSLRQRIRGTVPGTNNHNYITFRGHFVDKTTDGGKPDLFGTAGMYDIMYLLAYSMVALGDQPVTGGNLNEALKTYFTAPAPAIAVAQDITTTFSRMQNMQAFDFEGASGSLQFNVQTGEAPSDIQIWCLPNDLATAGSNSGRYYSADSDALVGSISQAICGFTGE